MRLPALLTILLTLALVLGVACSKSAEDGGSGGSIEVGYLTNGVDPFWDVAAAGARTAAKEFDVRVDVQMPAKGIADQKRMIEAMLARGVDGIAISPVDTKNQISQINEAAGRTNVITHDSDSPDSERLCFVGMDNYLAGRTAGRLIEEAMPDGGSVMLFVGRLEQLNAQQRRQGIIDELLDRPEQSLASLEVDAPDADLSNGKYTILSTRTDNYDRGRAKSNAEDAIAAHPDLGCMVGLFGYNTPACVAAVEEAGKAGSIRIVGFDELDGTLRGIENGTVHATVTQQPYEYGYHSVRILAALARDDRSVLPDGGFEKIDIHIVNKDNLVEFETELKKLKGQGN